MTEKKYVKLASKIYDLIVEEDPEFGDTVASLALVKLWVTKDFMNLYEE